ncbi:DUF1289 domain-containing protein [Gammaproteobacteria bacterium AS21]|jgi:predicted Fe-S protein YdhL (DUF1289 family)
MNETNASSWQDQQEMFHVKSPCIGVCTSGPKGYCRGCLRSRVERFHWQEMTDNQKFTVVKLCQSRKARILAARKKGDITLLKQEEMFADFDGQMTLF